MRVALLSPLFESVPPRLYGGTERVVYNLCRGLTEADIEVTTFASGDSCVEGRLVPVVEEALRLRSRPVAEPAAFHFKMLAEVARLADEFDVIHNHHDFWMLPLSRMTDAPVLTTLHGRLDIPELADALLPYRDCPFVSISDAQRERRPELRWIRTIQHGIDPSAFEFHPKPGKYLAFLGRISADKRPDWAIEMALRSGVPLKIAAKIQGERDQEYFESRVRPRLDGKFIEFVGEISEHEKSEFLGEALALAFPIDWPEPFGLVMIESLACGTPVLARPCGAVPEVLEEGITGFVSADVSRLADKVGEVASLDRAVCRRRVEDRFSIRRMTEDYIHVYRHLADFARYERRRDRHRRNLLHPVKRSADGNS